MSGKLLLLISVIVIAGFSAENTVAQTSRKTVGASEVNGTFLNYFSGKSKGNHNKIKILALGKGKLRVAFSGLYEYKMTSGEVTANLGEATGEAVISGDTAIFTPPDTEQCTITLKFLTRGRLKVVQKGTDAECGFGHNVSAAGNYKKISAKRPKFKRPDV